jgi:thiamine phosphate synthase YjbQ (UPF0047 family)
VVINKMVQIRSRGEEDIIEIAEQISKAVKESKIKDGIVTLFYF